LQVGAAADGGSAVSVGGACVKLLRELLAPLGMPVLDASHDGVRAASAATLRRALDCAPILEHALQDRRNEIENLGLTPQVDEVRGLSLVFAREEGIKRRISVAGAKRFGDVGESILTPNVFLRPVVESEMLPSVAY